MKPKTIKFKNPLTEILYQQSFKQKNKKLNQSKIIQNSIEKVVELYSFKPDLELDLEIKNIKFYKSIPPRVRIDYENKFIIVNYEHRIQLNEMKDLKYYEMYFFMKWKRCELNFYDENDFIENVYNENMENIKNIDDSNDIYETNYEFWRQLFITCEMADVILHITDCRSLLLEPILFKMYNKPHIIILNKIDLIDEPVKNKLKYPNLIFTNTDKKYIKPIIEIINKYKKIGIIGYPNVGKSSFINAIFNKKIVGVSCTPGKTKNIQTLYFNNSVVIDCPGLVFRRFGFDFLLRNGVLNVDQVRLNFDGDVSKFKKEIKMKFQGKNK